ncbi:hypothetical protein L1887_51983 [Cichorium endivia]|nr:hypothetical protein L1887_51983 [Cichorium endivia]
MQQRVHGDVAGRKASTKAPACLAIEIDTAILDHKRGVSKRSPQTSRTCWRERSTVLHKQRQDGCQLITRRTNTAPCTAVSTRTWRCVPSLSRSGCSRRERVRDAAVAYAPREPNGGKNDHIFSITERNVACLTHARSGAPAEPVPLHPADQAVNATQIRYFAHILQCKCRAI